jgi:hypothetical protein
MAHQGQNPIKKFGFVMRDGFVFEMEVEKIRSFEVELSDRIAPGFLEALKNNELHFGEARESIATITIELDVEEWMMSYFSEPEQIAEIPQKRLTAGGGEG